MIPQLSVLADAANLSQEGKLNLLGEFNTLFAAEVPVAHPILWFVAKMQAGAGDFGRHRIHLQVVSEDGETVFRPIDGELELPKPPNYSGDPLFFPILLQVADAPFPGYGTYTFELRADDAIVATAVLFVREPLPPPGVVV